jgi:hypothetical protein
MMYVAESTSVATQLCTSWALSLPGMSLSRDRYEQTVRFSWLARQPDNAELVKYIGSYYSKTNKVFRSISPELRAEIERASSKMEPWMTETPTKEQREIVERWEKFDLRSMASKRDALRPPRDTPLNREPLADLYAAFYQQFSSVTHCDMYGMRMLGLQDAPSGKKVLAADPNWPAVICFYTALFDLIQCNDAVCASYSVPCPDALDSLFDEWQALIPKIDSI